MRYLYTILFYLATPLLLLRLLWRSTKHPSYRQRLPERLGRIRTIKNPNTIWLHAVSLGESIAAAPLIEALLKQLPDYTLVVTTTTATGSAQVQKVFNTKVYHVYMPFDLPHVIRRFLNRIQPQQVILTETELWPNLLYQLKKNRIPTIVANARLSERSFQQYRRFKRFFRPLLAPIFINAQSHADAERFQKLGIDQQHITVTGNIKFDHSIANALIEQAKTLRQHWENRPSLIAASTHEGEENIILNAFKTIQEHYPKALLILVPRHPERFNKVAELCVKSGFSIARRSQKQLPDDKTAIYLGDTMGELMLLYASSQIAFVGGSLVPVGGHNLIEPASLSLPILSGSQLQNFIAIRDLLMDANALIIVDTAQSLAEKAISLFADANSRDQYGARALSISEKNRGAVAKHIDCVLKHLNA